MSADIGPDQEVPTKEEVLVQIKTMLGIADGGALPYNGDQLTKPVRTYTRDYLLWCSSYEASQLFPLELASKIVDFPDVIKPHGHASETDGVLSLIGLERALHSPSNRLRREALYPPCGGTARPEYGITKVYENGRLRRGLKDLALPDYPLEFISVNEPPKGRRRKGKL